MDRMQRIRDAADYIRERCGEAETGLILGSGLADTVALTDETILNYADIPGFPVSTAIGHKSEWVCGKLNGRRVFMLRGRFHLYEGYSPDDVVLPVRVMKLLGVKTLILTNASGGIDTSFSPGDLMLITDCINFSGINPLIGPNLAELGPRFPDMSQVLSRQLRETARRCAAEMDIELKEGVYIWFSGPSYETPAEIRMARILGADAVGMSTVPEIIAAAHCGIEVLGIACITNMAAGILDQPLTHDEIITTGRMVKDKFAALIDRIISEIQQR